LAYGDENEKIKAKAEACKNVQLISEYYRRYGATLRDDLLRIFLRDVAGASPREIQFNFSAIRRILSRALEYLKMVEEMKEEKAEVETEISQPVVQATTITTTETIPLPTIGVEGNTSVIRIPLNLSTIAFAKKQIEQLSAWLMPWLEFTEEQLRAKHQTKEEKNQGA